MDYIDVEKKYIDGMYPKFLLKADLKEYFDKYYPIDIHYRRSVGHKSIIMDLYYNKDDNYVKDNLSNIKNLLDTVAKELDLSLYSIKIYDKYNPRHKKGGTTKKMMQEMIKCGKNCITYKFITKPDYTSQKYMN